MKITASVSALSAALASTAKLAAEVKAQPAASCVLIRVNGPDGAVAIGNSGEAQATAKLDATETIGTGSIAIHAATLTKIVASLPAKSDVVLETSGGKCTLVCGRDKFTVTTIPADDFPEFVKRDVVARFLMPASQLRGLILRSAYAIPDKDHRRVLMGMFAKVDGTRINVTATDGKKLARASAEVVEFEGKPAAAILPGSIADLLASVLTVEGPVRVSIADGQFAFAFGQTEIVANAIEGKYPDCDAVIPKSTPIAIKINREALLDAVKRAGVLADEKNRSIILKFAGDSVSLSASRVDSGRFEGECLLAEPTEHALEVAFNGAFLVETLGRYSVPTLTLFAKNGTAPILFVSEQDEPGRVSLLMPIKLAEAMAPAAQTEAE